MGVCFYVSYVVFVFLMCLFFFCFAHIDFLYIHPSTSILHACPQYTSIYYLYSTSKGLRA